MNQVFLKTRELAEALLNSEEYQKMKEAEQRATANEEAAMAMGEYLEKRQKMEELLSQDTPDSELLRNLSEEIDAAQARLQAVEDVQALTEARGGFSNLIEQVNGVLRFMITGQTPDEDGDEHCTGSCASCGGCGHSHQLN